MARILLCSLALLATALAAPALARPLAVPLPLEHLDASEPSQAPAATASLPLRARPDGRFVLEELSVTGSRGAGLTAAARVHRQLTALGIPNEIHCSYLASAKVSRIEVQFTVALDEAQRRAVLQIVAPLMPQAAAPPAALLANQPC